ncbi:MAG: response regulator, partial [Bacteroides sp.]|nr:response regulator [Bacteroides sp.]
MSIKRFVSNVFVVLLCTLTCTLQAQTYEYIGVEKGLSNRRVFSIQKGDKGYMWFLTQDGIDRYDGKNFKHYILKNNGQEENSLWNLNWLYTDKQGILWEIGKRGKVFRYDANKDEFKLAYALPEPKQSNTPTIVSYGFIDEKDIVWLCTKEGIYCYNSADETSNFVTHNIDENISKMVQIDSTHFFIGTDKGIYYVEKTGNKLTLSPTFQPSDTPFHVNDIYYHKPSKKVLIGTFQQGIYIYDLVTNELTSIEHDLKDITINCIRYFNEREVVIGTDGTGVYRMNTENGNAQAYIVADYTKRNTMNGNNISDIYIDEEKRIWMANYPFGITVRDDRYPQYDWIKHANGNEQSLVNDQVNAIMEDSEGDIWFATNNGVSRYSKLQGGKWYTYLSSFNKEIQNKNHTFLSLCEAENGQILVGGYNSGLYLIDKHTGKIGYRTPESFNAAQLRPDKYIRTMFKDKGGKVWSGGYYNLKELDLRNNTLRRIQGLNGITVIKEKDNEHLWIGTANGLFLLEKQSGEFEEIMLPAESNYIYSLLQLPNGMLYIGTNSAGLLEYNPQNGHFEHYNKENSALISDDICHLLYDGNGRLVISLENGLSNFVIADRKFISWTKEHGLMTDHFNASSGTLSKDGKFLFGSTDGAIAYNKDMRLPRENNFKMVFSDLRIFNKTVYPGDEDSPLTQELDKTDVLKLKYSQNMFDIQVTTINFDNPSSILYTWKLQGFFNEWSEPANMCDIRFTNLSPGRYTLIVKAISSEDKRIDLQERQMTIVIEKPLWLSPWAILLYITLLLLIVYALLRFDLLQKKRKLSEDKIRFFINTAHDLRTPLTLIKVPLEEMEQKEPLSERGRESIYTALRNVNALLRLTTNLITFERADNYNTQLTIAEYELNDYMQEMLQGFEDYASTQHISFSYQSNFRYLNVWIDREKMESILKNLVSNALKYTPRGGQVQVTATEKGKEWSVEISDTGIGIPLNEQKRLFKTHFRSSNAINNKITGSGIGLLLVWKLVKQHKGRLTFHSKEGEGTSITVTFPIEAQCFKKAIRTNSKPQKEHITDTHTSRPSNIPIPPTIVEEKVEQNTTSKKKKLLIVEDNDELRQYLKRSFDEYIVQTSANGQEALNIIDEYMPDLIIADIMMPVMRGDELCKQLKNDMATSHIPVILLTALAGEEEVIKGLECGADE